MFKLTDLFDLTQTEHAVVFSGCEYPWDVLKKLSAYTAASVCPTLHNRCEGVAWIGEQVFIGEGTVVEDGVMIKGPVIIGRNCRVGHSAYVRAGALIGDNCLIGHSSEVKHSILFNGCQVPHFNFVGDSILGHNVHLGAGAMLSNVKSLCGNVTVEQDGHPLDTGLEKLGALLGDGAEIGCNAVLNPGSIIGRGAIIYPGVNWRGILPANMIAKNKAEIEVVVKRARELP